MSVLNDFVVLNVKFDFLIELVVCVVLLKLLIFDLELVDVFIWYFFFGEL